MINLYTTAATPNVTHTVTVGNDHRSSQEVDRRRGTAVVIILIDLRNPRARAAGGRRSGDLRLAHRPIPARVIARLIVAVRPVAR
jgi:hypothetical protein